VGGILSLLAGSAAIALGLCDAINGWLLAPGGLQVSTDVVGYPTGGPLYLRSSVADAVQSTVPDDVRLTLRRSREAPG
jgi:hypothetical protein